MLTMEEVTQLKNEANDYFKSGDYEKAIGLCKKALEICKDDGITVTLHKNAAANYLKINKSKEAAEHCDKALELSPNDPKALYRRACALENLERYEEAYRDAQKALISSPTDANAFKPLLSRLHIIVGERRNKFSQTKEKASRMLNLAFGGEVAGAGSGQKTLDSESALKNIMVLCRERAGIESLLEIGLLGKIKLVVETKNPTSKDIEKKLTCIRIMSEIVKFDSKMCKRLLTDLGIPFMMNLQDIVYDFKGTSESREEILISVQYLWQTTLDSLSGAKLGEKPNADLLKENKPLIDTFMTTLTMSINSRSIKGEARDSILQILIKNIEFKALCWAETFLEIGGLTRLTELASEVPELKIESGMELTSNTRSLVSVLYTKIYDNMYYDKIRDKYRDAIEEYVKQYLITPDLEEKVRVVTLFTTLLLGPADVGNAFIGRPGIIQMILVMANSDDYLQQRVACEALIAAASKKDKAKGIITEGVNILKRLYHSKSDDIKVRALVGLSKLGSTAGTDASWRPFSDGSNIKLTEACKRFLLNPAKDVGIQRWAVEGLSYLTLDAEVKEKLIEDTQALKVLLEMSRHANKINDLVYPIITSLVNLVNAYDKQEIIPEMMELAKFAKHHIPEEHEFDDPDFIDKRIEVLTELGVTSCLVNLSTATESENILELVSRLLNAICERDKNRGLVVAQGGARELIKIYSKTTAKGKIQAAQALARIGISTPPSVAFPGQRSYEAVKPILSLLHIECKALENYEALLALCNLAGESETLRRRIWDEKGYMDIENYIYEDHAKLKLAALQCITNMALSEKTAQLFEGENDRIKYMMLLCQPPEDLTEEDTEEIELMTAAAGILAIVSGGNRAICGKILTIVKNSLEVLLWLATNSHIEIQLRGLAIVSNIIEVDKEFAEMIIGSPIMEILMALSIGGLAIDEQKDKGEMIEKKNRVKTRALEALKFSEKWGLIKKNAS